jgi:CheY-like chemotaxis protein
VARGGTRGNCILGGDGAGCATDGSGAGQCCGMKADTLLRPLMIVDDNDDDVVLLARRMQKAGIKNPLLHFRTGADAFAFLRKFCPPETARSPLPCAMFLDVNMQGLSGFDVLLWARQQPALQRLKIFMLSGASEAWDAQIAAKLGADDYLVKFPEPAVFKKLIAEAAAAAC